MPRPDNSHLVIAAARRRAASTRKRAVTALRRMENAGAPITFDAVAREAHVSARGSTTRAIFAPKSSDSDNDSRLQRRPLRSPTGNARPTTRYYDVSRSRPPESSIWKQRTNSSAMRSRWL